MSRNVLRVVGTSLHVLHVISCITVYICFGTWNRNTTIIVIVKTKLFWHCHSGSVYWLDSESDTDGADLSQTHKSEGYKDWNEFCNGDHPGQFIRKNPGQHPIGRNAYLLLLYWYLHTLFLDLIIEQAFRPKKFTFEIWNAIDNSCRHGLQSAIYRHIFVIDCLLAAFFGGDDGNRRWDYSNGV